MPEFHHLLERSFTPPPQANKLFRAGTQLPVNLIQNREGELIRGHDNGLGLKIFHADKVAHQRRFACVSSGRDKRQLFELLHRCNDTEFGLLISRLRLVSLRGMDHGWYVHFERLEAFFRRWLRVEIWNASIVSIEQDPAWRL
jgi:hypothetical protein